MTMGNARQGDALGRVETQEGGDVVKSADADGLRSKFRALRAFVLTIPAERLDMHSLGHEPCGCVIQHDRDAHEYDARLTVSVRTVMSNDDKHYLFAIGCNEYDEPTGQPAKDEFLKRLSVIEEKYCGPSREAATPPPVSSTTPATS